MQKERLSLEDVLLDIAEACDLDADAALKAKDFSARYLARMGLPPERIRQLLTGKES